jgi:histidinol-phosphate/aromatic aminotransferase/cobyric acid decarboxylase-like protein
MTRGEASKVQRHLQDDGILVKALTGSAAHSGSLPNHLRIGVGRPEDTNALIASLKKLASQASI